MLFLHEVMGNFNAVFLDGKMAPMEPQQSEGDGVSINLAKHSPMKMNMALLIDFMIQKTYHDLTVMAELYVNFRLYIIFECLNVRKCSGDSNRYVKALCIL